MNNHENKVVVHGILYDFHLYKSDGMLTYVWAFMSIDNNHENKVAVFRHLIIIIKPLKMHFSLYFMPKVKFSL